MRRALVSALWLAACGDGGDGGATDAPPRLDAATIDGTPSDAPDAAGPDAAGAVPLPGFGAISGDCGVITAAILDGDQPQWFGGHLDFAADRYDDPAERDRLTAGGRAIVAVPNAGGSSVFSEVFAFEWLARCERATLLKTETDIVYDVDGKKADLLVELGGRKVGVSVTRAVQFPFGSPYDPVAATSLFERKLDDLQLATQQVSAADRWTEQMLVALAFDADHAQVAMTAWAGLDAQTRGATLLVVAVTDGDDTFIYTDQ